MLVVLPESVGPTEADLMTGVSLGLDIPLGLAVAPARTGGKRVVHAMVWSRLDVGQLFRRRGELLCRNRRDKTRVEWARGLNAPVTCTHCQKRAASIARAIGAAKAARAKLGHGATDDQCP